MTIDDNAGAQLGGAVIASKGGEYPESFAKDEDGMIIGILLGNMFEDGHIMSDAFDVVEYEEALEDLADDVENAILTCIHGGEGPPFEQETPNYLPSFQITLQREDLEHDTMAAAGKLILDHVLEHQRDLFNPYINLGWMLDKEESWMKNFKPNSPVVTFDPNPLLWAQLRKGKASASAEVVYHLPRLYYAVRRSLSKSTRCCDGCLTRSMRVNAALAEGLVEWTAPGDWHRSTQPNVCSLGRYRQEPIFRYVGCGYALTPTSSYPSIKAAHIWRWTATASEKRFTEREVFDDPLGAFYSMGHQAERPEEVLGHTALLVGQKGERIFADVFGMDLHRGLLFGWLRTKDNEGLIESISAFVLPGYTDDVDSDSSLPPFKKVHIQTYGLPRVIPPPHPDLKGTTVPLVCRQMPNHDSPNLLDDVVVQIPTTILNGDQHVEGVFQQAIGSFIIKHQLLHPLILSRFKQYGEKQKRLPIYGTSEQNDEHKAMAAHIARGQAPADFGYTYRFAISQMHPDDWEPSERLPVQGARQQPAEGAWIAPADWFEPCKPTIDPTGQYQAVDVMSYVGCGHVLPPWATYPPDKTRYVWSRLPPPEQENVTPASTYLDVYSATYKIPEPQDQSQGLIDVLGQTAMFTQGQWDRHILDVIGIDQPRGLVFGFSRLESYKQDKFRALRLINVDSSSSGMQNLGVGPDDYETKTFDKYGVFVVEPKPIQPAATTGGFSFAMGSRTFENIANGTWHLNQG
jgi:hypothetical protein